MQPSVDLFIVVILKPVFDPTNSAEQKLAVANPMSNGTLNVCECFTVMQQVTKTLKVSTAEYRKTLRLFSYFNGRDLHLFQSELLRFLRAHVFSFDQLS